MLTTQERKGGFMEKVANIGENSLLQILCQNFESLYYVDFDSDYITPCRMSLPIQERFGEYFSSSPSYKEAMTLYVNSEVHPLDKEAMLKLADAKYLKKLFKNRQTYTFDFRVERDGKLNFFRFKISNLDSVEKLRKAVIGVADVTEEMDRVNELVASKVMLDMLKHDTLTGLYSKDYFFKKVENYIMAHKDERFIMWTSDILGLKIINEKYGIEKGDEVLATLANCVNSFPNCLFGGRIEGDKFSVLLKNENFDIDSLNEKCLLGTLCEFSIPNVIVKHGVYYIKPGTSLSAQGMYDRSILALQSIKGKYGINVAEYDDKLREDLIVSRQVMEDADKALVENQFQIYYQPKHNVNEAKTGGAEALVRWMHPKLGFMSPGVFIPLFEKSGFITKLDYYTWEEVCKSISEWKKKGFADVPVSVNVSRRDFEQPRLADKIIQLVDKYGIDHSLFHIEVTESAYSDNPKMIENTIKKLHDNGFVIELDDFGTGYSSMTALSSLDLDIMKLDMSLIQNDIPGTKKNVLEFSMQLAKMMKLKTVAEGVETDEQAERIRALGGDYIQGYFYSKPLPKSQFEDYITREFN